MLRLGGFTFGYYATTLGKLRESKNAVVETRAEEGSGSLRYTYDALVAGTEKTYAWVSFSWDKERLKAEFHAEIDETLVTPDLNMPVECDLERTEGTIRGVTSCFLAFGDQRFHAPTGLGYSGTATMAKGESNMGVYEINLKDENGFLIRKPNLPEL
ncbi:MAG: hypothetical protein AB1733_11635 [Thermodesulfobacteriota bacterium]